ncbi:MAG: MOSC domain-containing protein [Alphaproteobacteria bacterium]|nr:MOSC domain-containing protein [Alphaproteobacteria bacterium]
METKTPENAGSVIAVARDGGHNFSKPTCDNIKLVSGLGVEGDAHFGKTVQHLYRIKKDPDVPNLRQIHLIHSELHDELRGKGFAISPGDMGENITTQGLDILDLPCGTILKIGEQAAIEITGLRNPCYQLNDFRDGLMKACLDKAADGSVIFKSGIMGVIVQDGTVKPGDQIQIELPAEPYIPLDLV